MKKLTSTFAAVALIAVALTACNKQAQPVDEKAPAAKSANSELKIAFVEVDSIMSQYQFCKDYSIILEKKSQNIQNTINAKGRSLQAAAAKFQQDIQNNKYTQQQAEAVQEVVQAVNVPDIPAELSRWLTEPLTEEPEYYQDEVYEQLKAKFRPKTKIDPDTMLPVYDDTYKPILDSILERFDNYEDTYYDGEDD